MRLSQGISAALCALLLASSLAAAQGDDGRIKHVLLISVDGMHAVDFANCANGISTVNNGQPYCPAIAALANHGVNYVDASTSKPSDSFPGLVFITTLLIPETCKGRPRRPEMEMRLDPAHRVKCRPAIQRNMKKASTSIRAK